MVQVGGASIADVHELAAHAERYGVDAVLCLPELFFKPKVEEDLVHYMKEVALCCPTRPLFYYHIPQITDVRCKYIVCMTKLNHWFIMNWLLLSVCSPPV